MSSYIRLDQPMGELAQNYFDALIQGERGQASELIITAVNNGADIRDIYLNVFQTIQYEIGRLWELNQISIAQEHYFSAATQLIMSQLYPLIFSAPRNGYSFVATSATNELHVIGLRMVSDFLEMDGWDTYYLGSNVPLEKLTRVLIQQQADVLGLSATMIFHVDKLVELIGHVRKHPGLERLKIVVGGYPFIQDSQLWQKVGADGHAADAKEAVMLLNKLVVNNS